MYIICGRGGEMESIGVKELRDNLSRILRKVESGKVIRVLRHGRGVVELRPVTVDAEQELVNRLEQMDVLGGGTGRIGPVKTVRNRKPHEPVSDLVREDRR
jgi:antitoxin (DNA-binding transcriptional repressor) of toxin-antitoxin stability system